MKKSIKLLITISLPLCMTSQQFDRTKIGSMYPAVVQYQNGQTENVSMKMQAPELLKKPENKLEIEIGPNNPLLKEINSTLGTTGGDKVMAYFEENLFEAFLLDGNVWAKRPNPKANPAYASNFVVLTRQGGIQAYTYIEGEHKEGTVMLGTIKGSVVWKWGDKLPSTNYKEMLADNSELAGALKANLSNLDSVLTSYNLWYEDKYPGRIKYYFQNGPTPFKSASGNQLKDIRELAKENKEKKEKKEQLNKEKMGKRPLVAEALIVSQKPNLPPKKETFSAKVKRFEQEGNKMAVVIESQKILARSSGGACLEGEKEKTFEDTEYSKLLVTKLNELYQTSIFELVDVSIIPVMEVKGKIVDNWWLTKYKVVVAIVQTQAYNATLSSVDQRSSVQFFLNNRLNVTEYIDDEKKSADYLKRQFNIGDGYSPAKNFEGCGSIEKFETLLETKLAEEKLEKDQSAKFQKLVDKWD